MTRIRLAHSIVALIVGTFAARPGLAQNQLWLEQFGSLADDDTASVASDGAGGVYLGGSTSGELNGPNAGLSDAWIARYEGATGNQLWLRQLGTSADDFATGVAPDGAGGVYVTGYTAGSLGGPSGGDTDVWLARYDSGGNQLWIRQLSSTGNWSSYDYAYAATADGSGGVYLTGLTTGSLGGSFCGPGADAWVAHYESTGVQSWNRQLGSPAVDAGFTVAPNGSGGVYVGGYSANSFTGYPFSWLAQYDAAGNQIWIRQTDPSNTSVISAATPDGSGGVFVGGATSGSLAAPNAGDGDIWLAHHDAAGNRLWIRQFGTNMSDGISVATPDGSGGVFVSGWTFGSLVGAFAGVRDAWLAQYDGAGNQLWIRQFGTTSSDYPAGAAPDGSGGVYLGGETYGDLGAPNAGGSDAWIARYDGVGPPQPTSYCTASTTANGCSASITANAQPSVTFTTPCVLSIASVEGQRQGLIFYGLDNTGFSPLPWSSGSSSFLCVKPPTQRTGPQSSGGAIASCSGTLSLDWNAFHAANPGALGGAITAGSRVYAQGWFRDPPAPKSTNLSNALELTVAP
jgi:hypothetical protein